eukprot:9644566-Alexandrium_andersonii.AAC.1
MKDVEPAPGGRAAKRGKAAAVDAKASGATQLAAALNGTAPRAMRAVASYPTLSFLDCGGGGNC